MTDTFKNFMEKNIQWSPLLGYSTSDNISHDSNNTQDESYRDMYWRYRRKLEVKSFFLWICINVVTGFITYLVCSRNQETVDPDLCVSSRSRRAAIIISFLFGSGGADRFYLGHVVSGVLKLLAVGIFNVWWVIDLVMIYMNVLYDANGCVLK